MNLFCAANFGESYYNDSKVEKESLFGQLNFAQSYYVSKQKNKRKISLFNELNFEPVDYTYEKSE